jgi:hypothetical protein
MLLANVILLSPIYMGQKGETLYSTKTFYFGEHPQFHCFLSDGPIILAHCKNNKLNLRGTSSKEGERMKSFSF